MSGVKGKSGIYTRTNETRRKMSLISSARKRKPTSEDTKRKISIAQKGKPRPNIVSQETKEKQRKIHLGKKSPLYKDGSWNYEKKLWHNRQRRILRLSYGGSHTFGEWDLLKAQYNFTCPCCKKSEPEIKLTVDHIIPLSKGGSDNIENIQPLCKSCNSRKNNRNSIKF